MRKKKPRVFDVFTARACPSPYAKGVYPPKPLIPILGGLLTFESDWTPGLGPHFNKHWPKDTGEGRLISGASLRTGISFLIRETTRIKWLLRESPRPHSCSS
jgi:hypothetical protein